MIVQILISSAGGSKSVVVVAWILGDAASRRKGTAHPPRPNAQRGGEGHAPQPHLVPQEDATRPRASDDAPSAAGRGITAAVAAAAAVRRAGPHHEIECLPLERAETRQERIKVGRAGRHGHAGYRDTLDLDPGLLSPQSSGLLSLSLLLAGMPI